MGILDNGPVTGEAVKSVHQLSRSKYKHHFCTVFPFPVSDETKSGSSFYSHFPPSPWNYRAGTYFLKAAASSPSRPSCSFSLIFFHRFSSCFFTESNSILFSYGDIRAQASLRHSLKPQHLNNIYLTVHLTGEPVHDSVPVLLLAAHLVHKLL